MQEEQVKNVEESAQPVAEEPQREPTPTELAKMRQDYLRRKKSEIEILEVEVKFLDLQLKHHDLTNAINAINEKIRKAKSEEFKETLKV